MFSTRRLEIQQTHPGAIRPSTSFVALVGVVFFAATALADPSLPDPTRPPAAIQVIETPTVTDQSAPLSLQAIFFADGRRVAIINDRRLQESDTIQSARVVSIERDHVRLTRGAETLKLRLVPMDIKRDQKTLSPKTTRTAQPTQLLTGERGLRP